MLKDIINYNIISIDKNSSIKEASKLMKNNNIGFIPIKDNDNYVGVITDRDICLSLSVINNINDCVKGYMTKNIIYLDINKSIDDALKLMSENKVKRLLIKEKDNTIGVLSLSDILNYTNNLNLIDTYKTIFYIHDNSKEISAEIDEFYL